MTAAELVAMASALPPDTDLGDVTFSGARPVPASTLRVRRFRERKALHVTEGGKGGVCPPKAESSEKREKSTEPADRLDQGEALHETRKVAPGRRAALPGRPAGTWLPPDDWSPNDGHRSLARELGLVIDGQAGEAQRMIDHAKAGMRKKPIIDWDAAFRTWLRNARDFTRSAPARPAGPSLFDRIRAAEPEAAE